MFRQSIDRFRQVLIHYFQNHQLLYRYKKRNILLLLYTRGSLISNTTTRQPLEDSQVRYNFKRSDSREMHQMDAAGKLEQRYRADRNGGVDVPQSIRDLMAAQKPPIKNLNQLAARMEFAPGTVHRIFSGKNAHTTLRTYKHISEICGWSLEQFFSIAYGNEPESIGSFLRARLKKLDISTVAFSKYLTGGTADGGSPIKYLMGAHKYDRLNLYWRLKSSLGITADTMYELLLIREPLTPSCPSEKISSSVSESDVDLANTNSVIKFKLKLAS